PPATARARLIPCADDRRRNPLRGSCPAVAPGPGSDLHPSLRAVPATAGAGPGGTFPLRAQLPVLGAHFGANPASASGNPGAGLIVLDACEEHEPCTLYVPDGYTPDRDWPLIVALHGASGSGREYVWAW